MPVGVELLGLPFTEPTPLAMGYDHARHFNSRLIRP